MRRCLWLAIWGWGWASGAGVPPESSEKRRRLKLPDEWKETLALATAMEMIQTEVESAQDAAFSSEQCLQWMAPKSDSEWVSLACLLHMGFTNMLLVLSDFLAHACDDAEVVLFTGMRTDMGPLGRSVDVSEFVDIAALNAKLAADPRCDYTRVVPRACLQHVTFEDGYERGLMKAGDAERQLKFFVRLASEGVMFAEEGQLPYAMTVLQYLEPLNRVSWRGLTLDGQRVELRHQEYDALHLNLDTEWILFSYRGKKVFFKYFHADVDRKRVWSKRCCSRRGKPQIHKFVLMALAEYRQLLLKHCSPRRPIVVATAIGKNPELSQTLWILEELVLQNPEFTFVVGRSESKEREINAAAESLALFHANTLIYFKGSTFSGILAKMRVEGNNGTTVEYDIYEVRRRNKLIEAGKDPDEIRQENLEGGEAWGEEEEGKEDETDKADEEEEEKEETELEETLFEMDDDTSTRENFAVRHR